MEDPVSNGVSSSLNLQGFLEKFAFWDTKSSWNPWNPWNPWKSLEVLGSPWKSMGILGNSWESLEILMNPWESLGILGHFKPFEYFEPCPSDFLKVSSKISILIEYHDTL